MNNQDCLKKNRHFVIFNTLVLLHYSQETVTCSFTYLFFLSGFNTKNYFFAVVGGTVI